MLEPGGRFVFFLNHPLLQAPNSGWVIDHILEEQYWRVGPYLVVDVTMEELAPGVVLPFVHRPLSQYVNAMGENGLLIERMEEPRPPDGFLARAPEYRDAATIPRLLLLVAPRGRAVRPLEGGMDRRIMFALICAHVLVPIVLIFSPAVHTNEFAHTSDEARYFTIAHAHGVPYRDFEVEYPPVAVVLSKAIPVRLVRRVRRTCSSSRKRCVTPRSRTRFFGVGDEEPSAATCSSRCRSCRWCCRSTTYRDRVGRRRAGARRAPARCGRRRRGRRCGLGQALCRRVHSADDGPAPVGEPTGVAIDDDRRRGSSCGCQCVDSRASTRC